MVILLLVSALAFLEECFSESVLVQVLRVLNGMIIIDCIYRYVNIGKL